MGSILSKTHMRQYEVSNGEIGIELDRPVPRKSEVFFLTS
ncbi:hypothetical protein FA11_1602 [Pelosinus fermentans A11]|uniref:Uncharacterized protein n=1 Tax=Pelosinus fermentans B4 TaxID=1149862 RepID=I9ARZ0_9FIRM|nr:hypothetical protein FB4_1401 [Pelosinus fermentans B4]EIW26598.1 hypothetical protein FA11_1602 [Pelosinus fermentans A11]